MTQKLTYIICFFLVLYILVFAGGCKKEYSYEGEPIQGPIQFPDSTVIGDSTIIGDSTSIIAFPKCNGCNTDVLSALTWSFKVGSSLLCGNITRGVVSPDGGGMTFFGPSSCSRDSGLIITAFFSDQTLKKDQSNITASRASLEYYDNTTMSDILQSKRPNIFSLIIDNYVRETGVATGTFNGSVLDKDGNIIKVYAGRFNVKF